MDYRDPDWVAERLGVEKNTVYKFLQDGTLPAVQLGRRWLISESRLERWLEEETERQTQARRVASSSAERTARRLDNFTPRARNAIRTAHSEARRYNHQTLGQEHLVLALAADADCRAAGAMAALGVDLPGLRATVESRTVPGDTPPPRRLARTPQAKKAMRLAMKESRQAGASLIGTDHLLMGVVLAGEGAGFDILTDAGLTADRLRQQFQQLAHSKGDEHV